MSDQTGKITIGKQQYDFSKASELRPLEAEKNKKDSIFLKAFGGEDSKLTNEELETMFNAIAKFAGDDKKLSRDEMHKLFKQFNIKGVNRKDLQDFLTNALSDRQDVHAEFTLKKAESAEKVAEETPALVVEEPVVETKSPVVEEPVVETKTEEPPAKPVDYKKAFTDAKNKVTIDETGSNQRINSKPQWQTSVVLPKDYDGNGTPSKISIALPAAYGQRTADGKLQLRYQTLHYDESTQTYKDKNGLREFQLNIGDDGAITLQQVNHDDAKVKSTLDKWNAANIANTRKEAVKTGEDHYGHVEKIEITSQENADKLLNQFADRNTCAAAYASCGSNNGYLTFNHGPLEVMQDAGYVKEYKDVEKAIAGMRASVPEGVDLTKFDELNAKLQSSFRDGNIRALETEYMRILNENMSQAQGVSYSPNNWLKAAGGATITPNKSSSMWETDAKFQIGDKTYVLELPRTIMNRTYDFQDIVGGEGTDAWFTSDPNANNRHGAIKVNDKELIGKIFKGDGKTYTVVNNNDKASIQKADGSYVTVEDIMNGKATFE